MRPTYYELKITLYVIQFKSIDTLTDGSTKTLMNALTDTLADAPTDAPRDVLTETLTVAITDIPRVALADSRQMP